jgi:protein SCO1/2
MRSAEKVAMITTRTFSAGAVKAGLLAAAVTALIAAAGGDAAAQKTPWNAQYFPNVELTTHNGVRVSFPDLIKGRTVAIELFYASCQYACPLETARLAQVQQLLGDRMGRDVFFFSITIDPAHDTPPVLKAYAEKYHAGPGWTFLTGKAADIELLSKKLGLYSAPDPENKDGHMPTLLIGNEATGQWMRASALDNPKMTATMISGWVGGYPKAAPAKSYAEAKPLPKFTSGQYVFATKCSACHSLDQKDKAGPDLAGIAATRDRAWLRRYIAAPEEMLDAGDPIATALFAKYRQMRMPNLELTEQQVGDVVDYLTAIKP